MHFQLNAFPARLTDSLGVGRSMKAIQSLRTEEVFVFCDWILFSICFARFFLLCPLFVCSFLVDFPWGLIREISVGERNNRRFWRQNEFRAFFS